MSNVYEVVERSYMTVGNRQEYGSENTKKFAEFRYFYSNAHAAKYHIKDWARTNNGKVEERGWKATAIKEISHNDWETTIPEFEMGEIFIEIHEVRGYWTA